MVATGIDAQAIRRAAEGPGDLVHDGLPVVVASGRLARQKGYDLLQEARARVVRDVPHLLLILNDGPEVGALQAFAESLGVVDSVQFAGRRSRPTAQRRARGRVRAAQPA